MSELSHPEKDLKIIHVAGTNGKGSTAEMMTNILSKAGYKVGKFISPHLIKYNERISIGNQNITDKEIENLITIIDPKIKKYNSLNDRKITLFELETTMALLYFYENNCDFVVLETGLGGLYDCTNIVNPIVSIITSIGYDHMQVLGSTLEEIAKQKAGIIKENSETIFVEQTDNETNNEINKENELNKNNQLNELSKVNEIIENTCKEKNNILHLIKKESIINYSYNDEFQTFDYKNYKQIMINLKGKKQTYNAVICIECAEILKSKSYNISEETIREGLKTVVHKARFEKICNNPLVIYDGAHNEPAIENLISNIEMYYKNNKKAYIVSILKSKDYESMLKQLVKDEDAVFIFTSGNDNQRYVSKEELYETARKYTKSEKLYMRELEEALSLIKVQNKELKVQNKKLKETNNLIKVHNKELKKENNLTIKTSKSREDVFIEDRTIFIIGSFYIYGTVIKYLNKPM